MEQIYTQSHEEFEVFTTVLSPQVCRKRVIFQHQGEMMVVAADYSADCDEEVCVHAGEVVLLLYQENADWCYIRLQNGKEGYLPTACFTLKQEPLKPIVTQEPQRSMQEPSNNRNGCAGGRSLKLPRRRLCQECRVHLDYFSGCSLVDVVTDMQFVRSAP